MEGSGGFGCKDMQIFAAGVREEFTFFLHAGLTGGISVKLVVINSHFPSRSVPTLLLPILPLIFALVSRPYPHGFVCRIELLEKLEVKTAHLICYG
jgi:hypothetical protein